MTSVRAGGARNILSSLTCSAHHIGLHGAFAFDLDFPAWLEPKLIFEIFVGPGTDLNVVRLTLRLHAAGDVHGVAPQIIDELVLSDHTGHYRTGMNADA